MKKLTLITALFLFSTTTTQAQKKDTTTARQVFQPVITDSLPIISIQDLNRYLSSIDPKSTTVYELDLLKRAFQSLVDAGIRNFANKPKKN